MIDVHPFPEQLLEAQTREQAQSLLQQAQADGLSILPCGNGTRLHRFLPTARPDRWLSLRGMKKLLWLDVKDQTCAVEAGVSLAELQQLLRPHGLHLDVLAPHATIGTLGGIFMSRETSLLESSCGPIRDQVLGATWLLADGKIVHSGARVVKSVAGYDVTRLFLGSRGRLAICLDLTLRLRPLCNTLLWFSVAQSFWDTRPTNFPEPRLAIPQDEKTRLLAYAGFQPQEVALRPISTAQATKILQIHKRACAAGDYDPPLPTDSPWLLPLAQACAPQATPFGKRP